MAGFSVQAEQIDLPGGAFFKSARTHVLWHDRVVLGFSQNDFRAYLYPVCTPAGFPVTSESPTDHPHHNSVWIGADHVTALLPFGEDRFEEATYSFYINETFQGRAPGRIVGRGLEHELPAEDHLRIEQSLEWIGPVEWGAPTGRVIAAESRTVEIRHTENAFTIDVRSVLAPTEWELRIGPTRHAWFGVRVSEPLRPALGGAVIDSEGHTGTAAIKGRPGRWVRLSGELAEGHLGSLTICRDRDAAEAPWSLHDWGTIDVNPLGPEARRISPGEELDCSLRLLVHDGQPDPSTINTLLEPDS